MEQLAVKQPKINRRFDLAICLEVAEHLSPDIGIHLVKLLTNLSDVILFSAAVPHQGGINHINEQWAEYWQEIFAEHGYEYYDVIRPKIWNNKNVKWWYKQNSFLVVKKNTFDFEPTKNIHNLIHPELFIQHMVTKNSK